LFSSGGRSTATGGTLWIEQSRSTFRNRQTKAAATDMFDLQPLRHISTLSTAEILQSLGVRQLHSSQPTVHRFVKFVPLVPQSDLLCRRGAGPRINGHGQGRRQPEMEDTDPPRQQPSRLPSAGPKMLERSHPVFLALPAFLRRQAFRPTPFGCLSLSRRLALFTLQPRYRHVPMFLSESIMSYSLS